MLIEKSGDLLASRCNVIAHQCNCFSMMGAGIAKTIKERYPAAYEADCHDARKPKERLGGFSVGFDPKDKRLIANLYGQYRAGRIGRKTNYDALASAWINFLIYLRSTPPHIQAPMMIGVPYNIGCGLAGGDWNIVRKILDGGAKAAGVDVYAYKL